MTTTTINKTTATTQESEPAGRTVGGRVGVNVGRSEVIIRVIIDVVRGVVFGNPRCQVRAEPLDALLERPGGSEVKIQNPERKFSPLVCAQHARKDLSTNLSGRFDGGILTGRPIPTGMCFVCKNLQALHFLFKTKSNIPRDVVHADYAFKCKINM